VRSLRIGLGGVVVLTALVAPTAALGADTPTLPMSAYAVGRVDTTANQALVRSDPNGTRCYTTTRRLTAYSYAGSPMWRYNQKLDWCGRNGRIVGTTVRTRWAEVFIPFWEFRGHTDSTLSNRGTSYTAFTQGSFSLCGTPFGGCVTNRNPYISLTVLPSGLTYGHQGG
jgi:hypothetical protein